MSHDSCQVCHRQLKNPKYKEIGYGPKCAQKMGIRPEPKAREPRAPKVKLGTVFKMALQAGWSDRLRNGPVDNSEEWKQGFTAGWKARSKTLA